MKTGFIDVGGGMRGIYASGVLDYCLDNHILFDVGIGISAGSANLVSYAAGQARRNHQFYLEYSFRREYKSWGNFFRTGSYIDLEYIYGTLSNSDGESPVDYRALEANPMELVIVGTDARTGEAKYFSNSEIAQDNYDVCKASSCIPFACKPYFIDGIAYYDGAASDCIPLDKAFSMGCDKLVLILTRPKNEKRSARKDRFLAAMIRRDYPQAADGLAERAARYNQAVVKAMEYEAEGRLLIIAPDDTCGATTLSASKEALQLLYEKGYRDAAAIPAFLNT